MSEPPLSKFQAALAAHRAKQAAAAAAAAAAVPEDDYSDLVPDLGESSGVSSAQERVNELWDQDDILKVYDMVIHDKREEPRNRREGIRARCPLPEHPDPDPDAWFNLDKQVLVCGPCGFIGWNKAGLVALAYGIPNTSENFAVIKREYAKRVHGFDYDAARAMPVPTPANPSVTPAPVVQEIDPFERAVSDEFARQLARAKASERVKQYLANEAYVPLAFDNLEDMLEEDEPEIEWTVDQLHERGTNTTITAPFKAGKSTLVMNLLRCLADGDPFMGIHEVRDIGGVVAYLNLELTPVQVARSLRGMGIKNTGRIKVLNLRGKKLDIASPTAFAALAGELKRLGATVMVADPWSGLFNGDENSNTDVSTFTKLLDNLKDESGVEDLFIPIHTGRGVEEGKERARGASRIDDWADNRWVLGIEADTGTRWLKNDLGRSPYMAERETRFDPATGLLTYSAFAGTRKEKVSSVRRAAVLQYIRDNPGQNGTQIKDAIGGDQTLSSKIIQALVRDLEIEFRPSGSSKLYWPFGDAPI